MRGGARPGAVVLGPSALAHVSLHTAAVRWRTVWPGAHCLTPEPRPPRERGGTAHKKWRERFPWERRARPQNSGKHSRGLEL